MSFRVGQRVECIRAYDNRGRDFVAKVGGKYTVAALTECCPGCVGLFFQEITNGYGIAWCSNNFRPIVDRKTDISVFTAMLTPNRRGVDA